MELIHVSWGGPDYWMSIGLKQIRFEDHPHFGPIVLHKKTADPLDNQPDELDLFWTHYDAWVRQGKKFNKVGDKAWAVYQTDIQAKRKRRKREVVAVRVEIWEVVDAK